MTGDERPSRALLERPSTFTDPDNYPAVSVYQPHAGLIQLAGLGFWGKELEVRPISTRYRGKLVICSAKRVDKDAYNRVKIQLVAGGLVPHDVFEKACGPDNCGKAVALFETSDVRRMEEEDHELSFTTPEIYDPKDHFVWVGGQIDALESFDATGAQGFFRVSRAAVDAAVIHSTTRAERVAIRRKAKRKLAKTHCQCGAQFPRHLADFMNNDSRSSHRCRCGNEYVVRRNRFVVKGAPKAANSEVAHGA